MTEKIRRVDAFSYLFYLFVRTGDIFAVYGTILLANYSDFCMSKQNCTKLKLDTFTRSVVSFFATENHQARLPEDNLGEQGWRSGESTRLPPMCPGFDSRTRRHMWVEFVVGSLPCSERIFSGYSGFTPSAKTNISKFQFDPDYCQALYHEPLARMIARALPVFDIKFTSGLHFFTFILFLCLSSTVEPAMRSPC